MSTAPRSPARADGPPAAAVADRRPAGVRRWLAVTGFTIALAVVAALVLAWRLRALDPPSLYLDDQWVALVVRDMGWREILELRPAIPLGFVALEKLAAGLSPDPEWPLQVVPLLCTVAAVTLIGILGLRVTGRGSLGVLAASMAAVDPLLARYGVVVKPYAGDGALVALLLVAGLPLLERWTPRRAAATALLGVSGALLSFPSLLVSVPLLNLAALSGLRRRRVEPAPRRGPAVLAVAFDLAVTALWVVLLAGQRSEAMALFWRQGYLPLHPIDSTLAFLGTRGRDLFTGALPAGLGWAALLVPVGLAGGIVRERLRGPAGLGAVVYGELAVISALGLYPLGTGRTDIFCHPLTLLLVVAGAGLLLELAPLRGARPGVALVLAAAVLILWGAPSGYRSSGDDAAVVRALGATLDDGDGLIVSPLGSFAVATYGPWPHRARPSTVFAHGFEVVIQRPRTLTLPPVEGFAAAPQVLAPAVRSFLEPRPARLALVTSTASDPGVVRCLDRTIREAGYRRRRGAGAPPNLLVYDLPAERAATARDPAS